MRLSLFSTAPLLALLALTPGCGGDEDATPNPPSSGTGGSSAGQAGSAGKGGAGKGGSAGGGQGGAGQAGKAGSGQGGAGAGGAGAGGAGAGGAGAGGAGAGGAGAGGAGQAGAGAGGSGAGGAGAGGEAGSGGEAGAGQAGAGAGGAEAGQGGAGAGGAEAGQGGAGAGGAGSGGAGQGGESGSSGQAGTGGTPPSFGLDARPSNKTCLAPQRPASQAQIKLEKFCDQLFTLPIQFLQAPGDNSRYFVVSKVGYIIEVKAANVEQSSVFLDIDAIVDSVPNEAGLLGVAFHPDFAQNGQLFVSYTRTDPSAGGKITSVIARYESKDGGKTIDKSTAKTLLELKQPYANHNGGMIAFGPDGFLYIGFGDGGSGGDPLGSGQKKDTLLGKILRIDVDGADPYGIPQDNPFAKGGGKPEIFAYGLRNPWRFSFDRATGDLWAGDVGQGQWEEIDLIKLGGNYGWNTMEGTHCYSPSNGCDQTGLILPHFEYDHGQGSSITGGYVYRGSAIQGLQGRYLYGDFVSGKIWASGAEPAGGSTSQVILDAGFNISSFGEDNDGNLYVLNYGGSIWKIAPSAPGQASNFPTKLSATGCVDPADPSKVAEGVIPYDVNSPLWSDGAEKRRWFAVPDGQQIAVDGASGDMDFPVGSVLLKEFSLGGKRIETRLFVRHDDGAWAGYSYEWDDAQTEATYVPGKKKQIGSQVWQYPSGAQCLACHSEAAGRTLGLEVGQLNRSMVYPSGVSANILATMDHIGLFTAPLSAPVDQLTALPDPAGQGALEGRARAYLHSNCSFCHRPGGTGGGEADYRFGTSLFDAKICGAAPQHGDLGVAGAAILSPGDPAKSVISLRMHALDSRRMPPLGSSLVDDKGTTLLDGYIQSLAGCPSQ